MEDMTLEQILEQANVDGTLVSSDSNALFAVIGAFTIVAILILVILAVINVVARWKMVKKMGGAGWSQIVPVYSEWVLSSAAGCAQALCIAFTALDAVSYLFGAIDGDSFQMLAGACGVALFVIRCIVLNQVAKRFGKGTGFTVGLVILPTIFYAILGFGSAQPVEDDADQMAPRSQEALA